MELATIEELEEAAKWGKWCYIYVSCADLLQQYTEVCAQIHDEQKRESFDRLLRERLTTDDISIIKTITHIIDRTEFTIMMARAKSRQMISGDDHAFIGMLCNQYSEFHSWLLANCPREISSQWPPYDTERNWIDFRRSILEFMRGYGEKHKDVLWALFKDAKREIVLAIDYITRTKPASGAQP